MDPGRALSPTTRLDPREHRSRRHLGNAERDRAIAEHHSVTDDHVGEQVRIVDPDHPRVARARPLLEPDESSGGERNAPVREASAADLRARQISEHGHWTAGGLRRLANHREPLEVLVELTVREIEPDHIGPGGEHLLEHGALGARRPDGGDDLGAAAHIRVLADQFPRGVDPTRVSDPVVKRRDSAVDGFERTR